jgi:hypothetical protein
LAGVCGSGPKGSVRRIEYPEVCEIPTEAAADLTDLPDFTRSRKVCLVDRRIRGMAREDTIPRTESQVFQIYKPSARLSSSVSFASARFFAASLSS